MLTTEFPVCAAWNEHYRTYANYPRHIATRLVLRERMMMAMERNTPNTD